MARGAPDYSNVTTVNPIHRLDDMGELAARLRSPITHDRAGLVVYIETFEYGVASWHPTKYGTGAAVASSTARSKSKGFSCKLTAGSDGSAAAKIFRSFPLPVLGKFGFEFSWLYEAHSDILEYRLQYQDGTEAHNYNARYRTTEEDVQIRDEDGNWLTVVTGLTLAYSYADFHNIKVVADFENDVWVRMIINDQVYDLSDYAAYVVADTSGPDVLVTTLLWGDAGYNGVSYIDDIIVTQSEP